MPQILRIRKVSTLSPQFPDGSCHRVKVSFWTKNGNSPVDPFVRSDDDLLVDMPQWAQQGATDMVMARLGFILVGRDLKITDVPRLEAWIADIAPVMMQGVAPVVQSAPDWIV